MDDSFKQIRPFSLSFRCKHSL